MNENPMPHHKPSCMLNNLLDCGDKLGNGVLEGERAEIGCWGSS